MNGNEEPPGAVFIPAAGLALLAVRPLVFWISIAALIWLVLWRALANYRWADRTLRRMGADAAWLIAALVVYAALWGALIF
jgi:hypothetical protein